MAVGAVRPERVGKVVHQREGPLGVLDRRRAGAVHARGEIMHADRLVIDQELLQRVRRQRRRLAERRDPVLHRAPAGHRVDHRRQLEPDARRHVLAAVAGVAGDPRRRHVVGPGLVDVAGHLDHAPRHDLGVERVAREIAVLAVAIGAALLGRDPFGHRDHQPVEIVLGEVAEHLDVIIDVARQIVAGGRRDRRIGVEGRRPGIDLGPLARELDDLHPESARAGLDAHRRPGIAPGDQQGRDHDRAAERARQEGRPEEVLGVVLVPLHEPLEVGHGQFPAE